MKALYLRHPHAGLIWVGDKTLIVKCKIFNLKDQRFLLTDKDMAYGIISIIGINRTDLDGFKNLYKYHRISDTERENRWSGIETFYTYNFSFKPFTKPKNIKTRRRAGTLFIREVDMMQDIYTYNSGDKTDDTLRDDFSIVCSGYDTSRPDECEYLEDLAVPILKEIFQRNLELDMKDRGRMSFDLYKKTIRRIKGLTMEAKVGVDKELRLGYVGSKAKIMNAILKKVPSDVKVIIDPMAGACASAYAFKRAGYEVKTGDILYYSKQIQDALLKNNKNKLADDDIQCLLNAPSKSGWITNYDRREFYAPRLRKYIDGYVEVINSLDCGYKKALARVALISTITSLSSHSAGSFGKISVSTAKSIPQFKRLLNKKLHYVNSMVFEGTKCITSNDNALSFLDKVEGDLVYLDPPYISEANTKSNYIRYTLMDEILLQKDVKSRDDWSDKNFEDKMRQILKACSKFKYILFSYKACKMFTPQKLKSLIGEFRSEVRLFKMPMVYTIAQKGTKERDATEILIFASNKKVEDNSDELSRDNMEKKVWTQAEATAWLKRYKRKHSDYEKIANYHVYRQRTPEGCIEFRGNTDPVKKGIDYGITVIYCILVKEGKRSAVIQSIKFYHGEGLKGEIKTHPQTANTTIQKKPQFFYIGKLKLYEFSDRKYLDIEGMIFRPGVIKNIPFNKEVLMRSVLLPKKGHSLTYVNWYHMKGEMERVGILKKTWWDPNFAWTNKMDGTKHKGARMFKATITDPNAIDRIWNGDIIYVSPEVTFTENAKGEPDTIQERGLALTNTPAIPEARVTSVCDGDVCKKIVDKR